MRYRWQIAAGVALSAFLLYLVFGKLDLRELLRTMGEGDYLLLSLSLGILLMHMVLRALRWGVLLWPIKKTRATSLLGTLFIGFMANNVLPARMGDVIRGYLLGRIEGFSKTSSYATLVAERFLDGFTILSTFAVLAFTLKGQPYGTFPKVVGVGGIMSLGFFSLTLVVFLMVKYRPETFMRIFKPSGWSPEAKRHLYSFREGLKWFDRPAYLIPSLALSYATWITYALGIHATALAFSAEVPFLSSFLAMVAVCVVTTLPFTPGYIGTYHAALSYALVLYGVPLEKAAAVALIFHALFFLPSTFIGLLFLWRYHLSLSALRQSIGSN